MAQQARDICLRQLATAPRTRAQLAAKLAAGDIPPDIAAVVLDRYTEVGLVDDTAFAAAWVRSRHAVRGLARRAVAQELRHRGVEDEVAAQALVAVDDASELEVARRLVERRLRTTAGLERQARTRRLVGMLARKGYGAGMAFAVVREALDAEAADTVDAHTDAPVSVVAHTDGAPTVDDP